MYTSFTVASSRSRFFREPQQCWNQNVRVTCESLTDAARWRAEFNEGKVESPPQYLEEAVLFTLNLTVWRAQFTVLWSCVPVCPGLSQSVPCCPLAGSGSFLYHL